MRIKVIEIGRRFEKNYKKLPYSVKKIAKEKEYVFRENPFDPRLETHKLHGKEKELWSFSITRSHKIKFIFLKEGGCFVSRCGYS